MKRFFTLCIITTMLSSSVSAEEILRGKEAYKTLKGAETLRFKSYTDVPAYIKFLSAERIAYTSWEGWMKANYFQEEEGVSFELTSQEDDQLGMTHYRYQQVVDGYPLTFGYWIVHTLNGEVVSMNGSLHQNIEADQASLSETQALSNALDFVGADSYMWEDAREEDALKEMLHDPSATYYPEGVLEVVNADPMMNTIDMKLAYRFNIYASEPMTRQDIFVDAANGEVVFVNDLIHTADSTIKAFTGYSGQRDIVADWQGSQFRLREDGRGNGISTYDMNNGTSGFGSDFTHPDAPWDETSVERFGTDAHWGAEMTYDYFFNHFGRNSIDDQGFELVSRVHYGNNYANAFWNGQVMTYGDGSSGNSPFTALDIAGHEIAHGLTSNTANLIYQNESGALNESFSDIFGAAIEFDALGVNNGDWLIGEDLGFIIRSMSNPNAGGDPDTYNGSNWYTGPNDNGGVHTNSGVQNYWFYLLSFGASGTNDIGNNFNVVGIGLEDAAAVAYRNLTVYLGLNSSYEDARFYGIESAFDLFGPCSQQVQSTGEAWYAVGLGDPYPIDVQANYETSGAVSCTVPFQVTFDNLSANATSFTWDFGDGGTSNVAEPSHTYTQAGTYTVKLVASSTCGTDSLIESNLISIDLPESPTGQNDEICPGDQGTLIASSNGIHRWYDEPFATTPIYEGDTFVTPVVQSSTPYYVESLVLGNPQSVGPVDNTIGTGVYFNNEQSLFFDAYADFVLQSVDVFALIPGERHIVIMDNQGDTVAQDFIEVGQGQNTLDLDFEIPAGVDYEFTIGSNSLIQLYRNNSGVNYPYELGGVVSITRSSASAPFSFYYFFYNWQVSEKCQSGRTELVASTAICLGVEENALNSAIDVYPNPNNGEFQLTWTDAMNPTSIIVRSAQGQVVFQEDGSQQLNTKTISLDGVSKGIYFLQIEGEEGTVTKQLLVQ